MPKSKRDLLKRQMAYAHRNIENAMGHLSNVEEPFNEQHPELAEALQVAIVALSDINGLLDNFAKEVWGRDAVNWDSYANLPEKTIEMSKKQLDTDYYNPRGRKPKKAIDNA